MEGKRGLCSRQDTDNILCFPCEWQLGILSITVPVAATPEEITPALHAINLQTV